MVLLENYLSLKEIEQLIKYEPELLNLENDEIENHILVFKSRSIKPETIRTCLLSNPRFLLASLYDIEKLLDLIKTFSDDLDNILEEFPEILRYTKEDIIETITKIGENEIDIEKIIAEFILNR